MTNNLDNLNTISKLDEADILKTIRDLPAQIERCWSDWQRIAIPSHYITCKNVLILGMGGSGVAGALVSSLARYECKLPVEVCRDYNIPTWVDKNTLVIAISFSGETEETLEAFRQAATKTEKLITISTGGSLASIGSNNKALKYQYEYSSQPRAAIGFSLTAVLAIFAKLHLIEIRSQDMAEVVELLQGLLKQIDSDVQHYRNPAKLLAQKIYGKIPVILASGSLVEVARRWKGDFNENAKNQAYFEEIPEMNHNALVGLERPEDLAKKVFFIILESNYNLERNKLRQNIVGQILTKQKIGYENVVMDPTGSVLAEMFQMILYGSYVSYYLAILNNVAPEPVKMISFLKEKLAEKS